MDSPIGVLKFASAGDRLVGDPGMEGTFAFPVCYGTVPGSYRDLIEGSQEACTNLCAAAKALERQGAWALAGDCGLMALYQKEIADSVRVPVVSSSLVLLPMIQQMLGETLKVGVLTGHSLLLQKKHLEAVGADIEKLVIQGMETQPHFCRVVIEGEDKQDYNKMLHDVLDAVEQMLHRCDIIVAILLECSNLTTFAREVAEHFDMPVFDVNMAIRMLYRSRRSDCYRAENIPKI